MNKSVYLERENLKLQKNYSIISKKKAISLRNRFKTDKNINININHNININTNMKEPSENSPQKEIVQ
jgi:hypothetical protein